MKLLITTVPWTGTESPIMAPALLKSMCVKKGIPTVGIDLNQVAINYVEANFNKKNVALIQEFFMNNSPMDDMSGVADTINFIVDKILYHEPSHVALSLLTYSSQVACEWICFQIRRRRPEIKIMIGGAGVFSTLNSDLNFGETLLKQKQIDYYIKGDGDVSLPDLVLQTGSHIGVNENNWQQVDELNGQPIPDYSDYDWTQYANKSIGILGSRGCVRHCTFCDIHEHWKKFQWRSGEDIFQELLWHNSNSGIKNFKFQDSLINGNKVEFRKLMKLLAKHNQDNPTNQIRWSSFFIFRPENQMPEEEWIEISKSAEVLVVGIESLNESVRFHMGKRFTNSDMHYCFDMCKKHGIKVHMLLIVGYVTDDERTNTESIEWFKANKHYVNDPIVSVRLGSTLGILPGTELYRRQEELGVELQEKQFDKQWTVKKNNNTSEVRLKWLREQTQSCIKQGFVVTNSTDDHLLMEKMMK